MSDYTLMETKKIDISPAVYIVLMITIFLLAV